MKYHWAGYKLGVDKVEKKQALEIPSETSLLNADSNDAVPPVVGENPADEDNFRAQIIQTDTDDSPFAIVLNMTKPQVIESCTQLLNKSMPEDALIDIAIGNCVISNYREPIIDKEIEEGEMRSTKNRQVQLRKNNLLKICQHSIENDSLTSVTKVEKQLLLGICLSKSR